MTKILLAVAALALTLAAGPAWAGPTDGSRQTVSPPTWLERKPPRDEAVLVDG
jgi:hypothetical protein